MILCINTIQKNIFTQIHIDKVHCVCLPKQTVWMLCSVSAVTATEAENAANLGSITFVYGASKRTTSGLVNVEKRWTDIRLYKPNYFTCRQIVISATN